MIEVSLDDGLDVEVRQFRAVRLAQKLSEQMKKSSAVLTFLVEQNRSLSQRALGRIFYHIIKGHTIEEDVLLPSDVYNFAITNEVIKTEVITQETIRVAIHLLLNNELTDEQRKANIHSAMVQVAQNRVSVRRRPSNKNEWSDHELIQLFAAMESPLAAKDDGLYIPGIMQELGLDAPTGSKEYHRVKSKILKLRRSYKSIVTNVDPDDVDDRLGDTQGITLTRILGSKHSRNGSPGSLEWDFILSEMAFRLDEPSLISADACRVDIVKKRNLLRLDE